MNLVWILTMVFVCVTLGVGVWGMRRSKNARKLFHRGRSSVHGPAFAYGTSYYSAVMFIGFCRQLGLGFGLDVLWISFGNTFLAVSSRVRPGYRTRE